MLMPGELQNMENIFNLFKVSIFWRLSKSKGQALWHYAHRPRTSPTASGLNSPSSPLPAALAAQFQRHWREFGPMQVVRLVDEQRACRMCSPMGYVDSQAYAERAAVGNATPSLCNFRNLRKSPNCGMFKCYPSLSIDGF